MNNDRLRSSCIYNALMKDYSVKIKPNKLTFIKNDFKIKCRTDEELNYFALFLRSKTEQILDVTIKDILNGEHRVCEKDSV